MEPFIVYLTYTHVATGILSLVVAPIAMVVAKGGQAHRVWGKIFFWSMTYICLSAIIISIFKWIPFLLLIAIFSFYSCFVAYRALYQKQLYSGKGVKWYDWAMAIVAGIFMVGFVAYGVYVLVQTNGNYFGFLAIGFGMGGSIIVVNSLRRFIKPPIVKHQWLFNHIGNMVGGFIASVTAFSAQTMHFLPGFIQWAWPSFIGVPLIVIWNRAYRKKLSGGTPISELLILDK
jgi:uncharacterized membrane protein